MTNEDLTVLILDKLNWFYDDWARKPHKDKNFNGFSKGDLVLSILEHGTGPKVAKALGCGVQTFNRTVEDILVPIFGYLQGGGETWKFKLLTLVKYKKCSDCGELKPFSSYHIDNGRATGRYHYCKKCRAYKNASLYGIRKLRIPIWYSTEKDRIAEFYDSCPEGYHVDHIIPLQGDLVSGLHTLNNLQYLSAEANIQKGSKFDIE